MKRSGSKAILTRRRNGYEQSNKISRCRTKVEMSKRFVNPALFALLCLVLLIWQLSLPALAQVKPQVDLTGKNVLILNAFESNVPAFEKTNQGLSAALRSGGIGIRNQFYEHLDLVRNPSPEYRKHLSVIRKEEKSVTVQ